MGPFLIPPFADRIGILPLSTHPKKDSGDRCIILDLSYPHGHSVNSGIDKEFYADMPIKLAYPTVNMLARRIVQLGVGYLLYKRDLSFTIRQLPLDTMDYCLIGMRWKN